MQKESIFFNQKGATAVEFAIVLSLLLVLIFGIIEFGLAIFNRQVITNAAREGARSGIIVRQERLPNNDIKAKVREYAAQHLVTFGDYILTVDDIDIKPVYDAPQDEYDPDTATDRCVWFGCDLEVTVNYEYEFLFLSNLGIGPIVLRATSVMKME